MKVEIENFDSYIQREIKKINLINDNNIQISLLSQGAIWYEFLVPDQKNQKQDNLLLNFNNTSDYYQNPFYISMAIGRTGGRITKGEFIQDNKLITLPKNEGNNTLHGGPNGFHSYNWKFSTIQTHDLVSVKFERLIESNSDGYPGDLKVSITYTLDNNNRVTLDYQGKSLNEASLFNPTNHAYFNLESSGDILKHELKLNSHSILDVNTEKLPTGKINPVDNTPFDFTNSKKLASAIDKLQDTDEKGLDDIFVIDSDQQLPVATLKSLQSKHQLEIYSNRNGLVVFTANSFTNDMPINTGNGHPYQGIALETQTLPDSVNHPDFGSVVIHPNQQVNYQTVYQYKRI